jgi:hypothetical protein
LQLQELYVAANKVTDISGLTSFSQLTQLELGSNRIKWVCLAAAAPHCTWLLSHQAALPALLSLLALLCFSLHNNAC